jgi:hypothetical protein
VTTFAWLVNSLGIGAAAQRIARRSRTRHLSLCFHDVVAVSERPVSSSYSYRLGDLWNLCEALLAANAHICHPQASDHSEGVSLTFDDGIARAAHHVGEVADRLDIPMSLYPVVDWLSDPPESHKGLAVLDQRTLDLLLARYPRLSIGSHGPDHQRLTEANFDRFEDSLEILRAYWPERTLDTMAAPFGDDSHIAGCTPRHTILTGLGRRHTGLSVPRLPMRLDVGVQGVGTLSGRAADVLYTRWHQTRRRRGAQANH